jgi:hypothetical protein
MCFKSFRISHRKDSEWKMPDISERLSTSCTKDPIGRSSESFTGSKEEAVVEEVEEVEAVDKVEVEVCVCCAMDKGIRASGCF